MVSVQSIFVLNALDSGELGRSKNPSYFDMGQIVMAKHFFRASLKRQGLWGAPGQQRLVPKNSNHRKNKPQTGDSVLDPQRSLIYVATKATVSSN